MERLKWTVWLMLNRAPWLRRILQKTLWRHRTRRAYKQRVQDIPPLLDHCNAKRKRIDGPEHIIFIVIDALRKNHLPLYGYYRATTPFLQSIADKAAVFENAVTPSPWTYPAVASMLTGLYPHNHGGMRHKNDLNVLTAPIHFRDPARRFPSKVRRDILTLPEILASLDYESHIITAIVTAAMATAGSFKHSSVCNAGADYHLKRLLRWLKKNRAERSFVYFHIGDLHEPINAPARYRDTFGKIADIPNLERWEFQRDAQRGDPDFELYQQNRCKLYDCALRSVDAQLARLFRYLEQAKTLDSSLIFITADHGEEFWEHMELEQEQFYDPRGVAGIAHGHNLFQEVINVPLICTGPGVTPGRYSHNVSLVDLVPTVLEICGIDHKLALDGHDLFDCSDTRFLISEGMDFGYEKKAIVQNNWKLIEGEEDGVSLLFDLSGDPKEKQDLAKINPEKLQELKTLLPKTQVKGEALEVDRDIEEQLQSLGYM